MKTLYLFDDSGKCFSAVTISDSSDSLIEGLARRNGATNFVTSDSLYNPSAVYFSSGKMLQLPARPSIFCVFDYATAEWKDPRTLDDLKAAKNDEINAARLAANCASFMYDGKAIACDTLSRGDIDATNGYVSIYGALPDGWLGAWKAMDNSYVAIPDVATWKSFYSAMFVQGNANFAHAQELKAALALATTPEEVSAIVWAAN